MRKITAVDDLEAVVGTRPLTMLMKSVDEIDDDSKIIIDHSPLAGFGYRDPDGVSQSTFVGGAQGFARVESSTRLSFALPDRLPAPVQRGGVSLVFLLPGIGETLRLVGPVAECDGTRVAIDLEEAWIHCAKCVLRSRLWEEPSEPAEPSTAAGGRPSDGPLSDVRTADLLARSTFAIVSSWDATGSGDTSPKGDLPGFLESLDGRTLAIPDRKGNRRTDTFHNLTECGDFSLAALVPACNDVVHLSGSAYVTDDPVLLSRMAHGAVAPKAATIFTVGRAAVIENEALRASRIWHPSDRVDVSEVPDLMAVGARHIGRNKAKGVKASMMRTMSKGMGAAPKLLRRGVDGGYRKELKGEGFLGVEDQHEQGSEQDA